MKFIQIGDKGINLDLVTHWTVLGKTEDLEHDYLEFYAGSGYINVRDDTPGYASLKAYLLTLCVARFDAESDKAAVLVDTGEITKGFKPDEKNDTAR